MKRYNPQIMGKKRAKFLKILAQTGNVCDSARLACLGRPWLYKHRHANSAFAAAWDRVIEMAADHLEAEARRRAVDGTWEPVFYQGDIVGGVRRYSDTLLIVLLKANKPDKFADRRHVSGPGGGAQEHNVHVDAEEFVKRLMTNVDGKPRGLPEPHEMPPEEDDEPIVCGG